MVVPGEARDAIADPDAVRRFCAEKNAECKALVESLADTEVLVLIRERTKIRTPLL